MTPPGDAAAAAWLFAVDPAGTGVVLRASAGPARDRWLQSLRAALPDGTAVRRVPLNIGEERLGGGLDLAATLAAGRPVLTRGLLAEGGVLLLAMAERIAPATAARLAAVDGGPLAAVALDEGIAPDERPPAALTDRLAFHVELGEETAEAGLPDIASARALLPGVRVPDGIVEALCAAAAALGVASMRAPTLALRAARAAAALAGREEVAAEDAALAARLVLAPRATVLPEAEAEAEAEPAPEPTPSEAADASAAEPSGAAMEDVVLQAAQAAIPAGLLQRLQALASGRARTAGASGALHRAGQRGRPAGVRPGDPRAGLRLNLLETLRAAAPWQALRGRDGGRIQIRRADFRVTRLKQRAETTTVFAVDASGSAALNRLAEAKGAVELLLAECYVRRDRVAVLAFRGRGAQLLLPPTRSLPRAKRSLAGLPGGGGTPLAAGIDAGAALADAVRRRGGTPMLVLLTDGRANVALDGKGNRAVAEAEASASARRLRAAGISALLVDTSPRPHPPNRRLAAEMGARYVALPYADARSLSRAVQDASA